MIERPADASPPGPIADFDPAWLADMVGGVHGRDVAPLLHVCLVELGTRLPRLVATVAAGEAAAARRETHALLGLAATYGFLALAAELRGVAALLQADDLAAATRQAEQALTRLPRAEAAMQSALQGGAQ